jgi:5-methylthioadenosine/S-adenosylhomocysteine deaminase
MPILIENACVVLGDERATVRDGCDILIDNDRIAAVGKDLRRQVAGAAAALQVIDGRTSIVIPGLINAHLHSNEAFEQGMSDNLPLELWRLRTYPPFGVPPLTEEDFYLRALMAGIQSIRSGVTTVQDDLINPACTPDGVDGACRAYQELGLRAWVTTSLGDRGLIESHPFLADMLPDDVRQLIGPDRPTPAADQIALFERNHARWNGAAQGRLRINLGPRGPQRATFDLLRRIAATSERYGCAVHMHVLETRTQAVTAQREHGRSWIAVLHELGLLSPRLTINHGIWLTDDDIALLADNHCAVTHNSLSNLKIGSGYCPVRRLLDAGVAVALGTDGLATSDTADLMEALRTAALIHKPRTTEFETWIDAHDVFRLATRGGARSGLMADDLGEIAPGRKADLALLDRTHWGFVPLHDPVAQLAYSVSSEAVRTVIVDGAIVMWDRKLCTVDERAVRERIAQAASKWRRDVKPAALAAADRLFPVMTKVYREAIHAFETEDWAAPLRDRAG